MKVEEFKSKAKKGTISTLDVYEIKNISRKLRHEGSIKSQIMNLSDSIVKLLDESYSMLKADRDNVYKSDMSAENQSEYMKVFVSLNNFIADSKGMNFKDVKKTIEDFTKIGKPVESFLYKGFTYNILDKLQNSVEMLDVLSSLIGQYVKDAKTIRENNLKELSKDLKKKLGYMKYQEAYDLVEESKLNDVDKKFYLSTIDRLIDQVRNVRRIYRDISWNIRKAYDRNNIDSKKLSNIEKMFDKSKSYIRMGDWQGASADFEMMLKKGDKDTLKEIETYFITKRFDEIRKAHGDLFSHLDNIINKEIKEVKKSSIKELMNDSDKEIIEFTNKKRITNTSVSAIGDYAIWLSKNPQLKNKIADSANELERIFTDVRRLKPICHDGIKYAFFTKEVEKEGMAIIEAIDDWAFYSNDFDKSSKKALKLISAFDKAWKDDSEKKKFYQKTPLRDVYKYILKAEKEINKLHKLIVQYSKELRFGKYASSDFKFSVDYDTKKKWFKAIVKMDFSKAYDYIRLLNNEGKTYNEMVELSKKLVNESNTYKVNIKVLNRELKSLDYEHKDEDIETIKKADSAFQRLSFDDAEKMFGKIAEDMLSDSGGLPKNIAKKLVNRFDVIGDTVEIIDNIINKELAKLWDKYEKEY